MREIKFQFVVEKKHLSLSYTLDQIMEGVDAERVIQDMHHCDCQLNESVNHCQGDCWRDDEDAEITDRRQFTGLYDKDGVEIWESDLLRINYPVNLADGIFEAENLVDQEIICQVVFNDKLACFDLVTIKKDEHLSAWSFCGDDNDEITVIGNIYQYTHL